MLRDRSPMKGLRAALVLQAVASICSVGEAASVCSGLEKLQVHEVADFFTTAVNGQRARSEIISRVDAVLFDLENGCTTVDFEGGSDIYEKVQVLAWQFLHDGPRLLRATELRIGWIKRTGFSSKSEMRVLAERARSLRAYMNDTAARELDQEWPPPAGRVPYPRAGCGRMPREPVQQVGGRTRGHGGWLTSPQSEAKWGGGNECTVRVLSVQEWRAASDRCLAALFLRPFIVRGGADEVLNHSLWSRDSMLDVLGDYAMEASYIDNPKEKMDNSDASSSYTFAKHLENIRNEAEAGQAEVHLSRTPLRTRGVLYEHVFGGSDMISKYHSTMLRGMQLPKQLDGFVNTHSPLLINLALGAGGSGVTFHRHDAALNAVVFGSKRWMLFPPIPVEGVPGADKAAFSRAKWLAPTAM
eukprot:COSAG02_NODE_6545_length_3503_cov_2.326968_3_plen_414_part_00